MILNRQEHSYEELRELVIAILSSAAENGVNRFEKLMERIALELGEPNAPESERQHFSYGAATQLHPNDAELVLEIVWELFRQGIVTLGLNPANPGWPWLRLSRFGECALQQGLYRFHNKPAFMKALRSETIDISPDAVLYLREAVAAFYTDCLLSTCIMLSVAAESEFLRLLDVAKTSKTYGKYFSRIGDGLNIRAKIMRFGEAIKPILTVLPEIGDLRTERRPEHNANHHPNRAQRGGGALRGPSTLARPSVRLSATLHPTRRAVDAVAAHTGGSGLSATGGIVMKAGSEAGPCAVGRRGSRLEFLG